MLTHNSVWNVAINPYVLWELNVYPHNKFTNSFNTKKKIFILLTAPFLWQKKHLLLIFKMNKVKALEYSI